MGLQVHTFMGGTKEGPKPAPPGVTPTTLFLTSRGVPTPVRLEKGELTLSLPLGGVATLAAGGLLQVVGLRATAAAQRVCLVAALAE